MYCNVRQTVNVKMVLNNRPPGQLSRGHSVSIGKGYGLDGRCSIHDKGNIILFLITSRQAVEPTRLPTQLVPGTLPQG
jgi:hypothetical protein